jgi:hypothetical protein
MLLLYRHTIFISIASPELLDSRNASSRSYLPQEVIGMQIKRTYLDCQNSSKNTVKLAGMGKTWEKLCKD